MRRSSSSRREEGGPRKVRFCGQAKRHDGLLPRQARFEQLITSFFQSRVDFTEFAVLDLVGSEAGAGLELAEDLSELVVRMQHHQHDRSAVALLPGGGGLGLRIVIAEYLVYMERLYLVVKSASDRMLSGQSLPSTNKRLCGGGADNSRMVAVRS